MSARPPPPTHIGAHTHEHKHAPTHITSHCPRTRSTSSHCPRTRSSTSYCPRTRRSTSYCPRTRNSTHHITMPHAHAAAHTFGESTCSPRASKWSYAPGPTPLRSARGTAVAGAGHIAVRRAAAARPHPSPCATPLAAWGLPGARVSRSRHRTQLQAAAPQRARAPRQGARRTHRSRGCRRGLSSSSTGPRARRSSARVASSRRPFLSLQFCPALPAFD